MTARLLVGDVFDRMAELPDGAFDMILTSPPFLALRSYLPDGHPDKAKEIGSEATPAEFLDTLLALTAEWRRLLAPHGSLVVELGDTYAGSGGAGGDYDADGLREGQPRYKQSDARKNARVTLADGRTIQSAGISNGQERKGAGWPLDKSLTGIPTLYTWSLAYGRNLLTGQPSPAGMWRIRNLKPWIRSNPPVGALGDKERPATSYITVATLTRDRWFDLDAVRTTTGPDPRSGDWVDTRTSEEEKRVGWKTGPVHFGSNPAGAPPRDWWHHVDAVIDAEIDRRAGTTSRRGYVGDKRRETMDGGEMGPYEGGPTGARGVHIRRALENAGILTTLDALDISPKGYAGAHYAVWPPELCRLLIDEMCPRRVCTVCGEPSRRIVETERVTDGNYNRPHAAARSETNGRTFASNADTSRTTVGWSDCGHETWRPGHILDSFAGSGTTLAVATGMARTATGIDLDPRNADLALERCGMFLEVDEGTSEAAS